MIKQTDRQTDKIAGSESGNGKDKGQTEDRQPTNHRELDGEGRETDRQKDQKQSTEKRTSLAKQTHKDRNTAGKLLERQKREGDGRDIDMKRERDHVNGPTPVFRNGNIT